MSDSNKFRGINFTENDTEDKNLSFQERLERSRFQVQKKRQSLHTVLLLVLLCFAAYVMSVDKHMSAFAFISVFWITESTFADYFLSRNNYNNKYKHLLYSKLNLAVSVMFFGASFAVIPEVVLAAFAVYVLYYIEYVQCVELSNQEIKERTAVTSAAIFLFVYVAVVLLSRIQTTLLSMILLGGTVCIALYTIVEQIHQYVDHYLEYIVQLNQINADLNERNSHLNEHSVKVKEVNDLLGVQKIELSKAYETIQSQNQEMLVHNEVLGLVSTEKDMKRFGARIVDMLLDINSVQAVGLYIDADMYGNRKPLVVTKAISNDSLAEAMSESAQAVLEKNVQLDTAYVISDLPFPDYFTSLRRMGIRSLIEIPISIERGRCGAFVLASMHDNQFQTSNADFYVSIATQIGIAVQNASLYASLENLATRDGLTGIYNRRHFNLLFNEYVAQSMDQRIPIAVALFDIDKFKNVNDTYGHSFGDTVIVSVSHTANEVVEENGGILGRYGGEEFMMAFLGKTIDDILPIIRTIHERIKNTELMHNEQVVHINVSIGVTDYPHTCSNPADLLNHADWAMYYSKQHGRGRITIDGPQVRSESLLQ